MRVFNTDPRKKLEPGIFDSEKDLKDLHILRDKINELYIKFEESTPSFSSVYSRAILDCLEIIDQHIDKIEGKGKRK